MLQEPLSDIVLTVNVVFAQKCLEFANCKTMLINSELFCRSISIISPVAYHFDAEIVYDMMHLRQFTRDSTFVQQTVAYLCNILRSNIMRKEEWNQKN